MNWLSFLLQTNLYLVLFFGFYRLLLHSETFYNLNRAYLVGAVGLSLGIPFWQSDFVQSWLVTEQVEATYAAVLSPVIIRFEQPIEPAFTWFDLLKILYFSGTIIFAIRLIIKLLRLNFLLKTSLENESFKNTLAFSFFNKIFVSEDLLNRETILTHEKVHAQHLHSADVLLFEIVAILCWFNPVVYFYKQAIKHIHEFIADEIAAKNEPSKATYAMLLFSQQFGVQPHDLTNSFFNHSLLKRRIMMLNKPRSRRTALLKYGLSVPLFVAMLIFSSATLAKNKALKKAEQVSPEPKKTAQKVQVDVKLNPAYQKKHEEVFDKVEKNPEFPGGVSKLYEFVAKHLKYPKAAIQAKTEGKVFVKFIVRKDGKISNVEILKGIGSGCDEEAKRVISIMPKWTAGRQNGHAVNVYFTMPVVYQLGEKDPKTSIQQIGNEEKIGKNFPKDVPTMLDLKNKNKDGQIQFDNFDLRSTKFRYSSKDENQLVIVDGKVIQNWDLKTNPEDIESMTVLKNESATTKYGEKGKNGVIIITTKKKN